MEKKINIIGAGIAGLSAGCYLQMNGYDTEIFEMHTIPGGLCTAWKRGEYVFDGCIHWLVGSQPSDPFYNLWNELVDMSSIEFVEPQEALRIEDGEGQFIRVFSNIDKLEEEMLAKAPGDKEIIIKFANAVRKFSKFEIPIEKPQEMFSLIDKVKFIFKLFPYFKDMKYWMGMTAAELACKCTDPLLKKTFEYLFFSDMAALFLVFTQAWRNKGSAGYPVGGSLQFARKIEEKYKELGGKIHYRAKVSKIVVENDLVKGVQLGNDDFRQSDIVISAADGRCTIYDLLEGKYTDREIDNYYSDFKVFPSYLQVSLGLGRTFDDLSDTVVFPLDTSIKIDSSVSSDHMGVRIFSFDPTMAPQGKTVLIAIFPTENDNYWQQLTKMIRRNICLKRIELQKMLLQL